MIHGSRSDPSTIERYLPPDTGVAKRRGSDMESTEADYGTGESSLATAGEPALMGEPASMGVVESPGTSPPESSAPTSDPAEQSNLISNTG